ncbi:MAG: flagellar hook-length control protein FliK [Geminicoccaceae bacterium]
MIQSSAIALLFGSTAQAGLATGASGEGAPAPFAQLLAGLNGGQVPGLPGNQSPSLPGDQMTSLLSHPQHSALSSNGLLSAEPPAAAANVSGSSGTQTPATFEQDSSFLLPEAQVSVETAALAGTLLAQNVSVETASLPSGGQFGAPDTASLTPIPAASQTADQPLLDVAAAKSNLDAPDSEILPELALSSISAQPRGTVSDALTSSSELDTPAEFDQARAGRLSNQGKTGQEGVQTLSAPHRTPSPSWTTDQPVTSARPSAPAVTSSNELLAASKPEPRPTLATNPIDSSTRGAETASVASHQQSATVKTSANDKRAHVRGPDTATVAEPENSGPVKSAQSQAKTAQSLSSEPVSETATGSPAPQPSPVAVAPIETHSALDVDPIGPPVSEIETVGEPGTASAGRAADGARQSSVAPPAQQLSMQLSQAVEGRLDRLQVQLEPAELGKVDIRLDFGDDGLIAAHIVAERPETLELLQKDQRQLQAALERAGFAAGDQQLSFQSSGQQNAGGEPEQNLFSQQSPSDAHPEIPGEPTEQTSAHRLRLLDINA